MRILWFNWRDIKHPESGGAEVLTHEIMKRLVQRGYDMTLFCPKVKGRPSEEQIDGVNIVRGGGKYTTYSRGKSFFKRHGDRYDLVIDEVNPRPFLNPRILNGKPVLVLFHQLIREEWFHELPFPFSYFCYLYEDRWLLPYRRTPTLTVSQSSKNDLEIIGFTDVKVIPMGISVKSLDTIGQKEEVPTIVFIGRLKKHKLPNHAINAFKIIKNTIPSAKMWVIGDGYMLSALQKMQTKDVKFFGYLENREKYDLLSRAHVLLVPSLREGWGMVVTEANAMGTPVVAYDVNGLRDSVQNGKNGILVDGNTPDSLAGGALSLLLDPGMLQKFSTNALEYSKQFSWDATVDYFVTQIDKVT